MDPLAPAAFGLLAVGLFSKTLLLTSLQGRARLGAKRFRWPEDAAHWGGTVHVEESEVVVRAQAALRNDGENHPAMLSAGAAWLALGAEATLAFAVFGAYVVLRIAHGLLLVFPRQPLRNRCYVVSLSLLFGVAIDVARRAVLSLG